MGKYCDKCKKIKPVKTYMITMPNEMYVNSVNIDLCRECKKKFNEWTKLGH